MALAITKANFESEVMNSDKPVAVDFWAPWCGPCRMFAPTVDELYNEMGDKAVIGKLNTDEENEIATKYKVMTIPTVIIFKAGQEVERLVGVQSKDLLKSKIEAYL